MSNQYTFSKLKRNKKFYFFEGDSFWKYWFYNPKSDILIMFQDDKRTNDLYQCGMESTGNIESIFFSKDSCIKEMLPNQFKFRFTNCHYHKLFLNCIKLYLKETMDTDIKFKYKRNSKYHRIIFKCEEDADFFKMKYAPLFIDFNIHK